MMFEVRKRWGELDNKTIKQISAEFSISLPTASKYIHMTEEDIIALSEPIKYKKRKTVMDDYLNIIYKMLRDKINPEVIMAYIIKTGYTGNMGTLDRYIAYLAKNNFNIMLSTMWAYDFSYPDDLTMIRRSELFRYMTTKNPKAKKNEVVDQNFEIIKEKYTIIAVLKEIYDEFHDILMGNTPNRLDGFIDKYRDSVVRSFVDGLVNDITSVKNAISCNESNGFVEGNNNKFKLIKRTLYGRASLHYLFKKCYLAFKVNSKNFEISHLL